MADYHFVTDRIAVGGSIGTAETLQELTRCGITHVVNMQVEFDDHGLSDGSALQILWNGCDDDSLPKSADLFWRGVLFSLNALKKAGTKVFIHCTAGVHRSPMMVLAVLRALGHPAQEAIAMILAARPQANFPAVYLDSVEAFLQEFESPPEQRRSGRAQKSQNILNASP